MTLPVLPAPVVVLVGMAFLAGAVVTVAIIAAGRRRTAWVSCPHCPWRFTTPTHLADHLQAEHADA
jgi:hypothetical protein